MQTYHRVHVQLGKRDRQQIVGMLNKGRESARVLRRALILRQLNQGQTAAQVAGNVGVAPKTVRAIARRYAEEGLDSALYEKPRPGKQRRLEAGQSQRIIAMVCSEPPAGQARCAAGSQGLEPQDQPPAGHHQLAVYAHKGTHEVWLQKKPDYAVRDLAPQRGFHCCLNLQTLQIPRNRCYCESTVTPLVGYGAVARVEFSVNLDSIPILRMADVVNNDIVVLTPKERHRIEWLAIA